MILDTCQIQKLMHNQAMRKIPNPKIALITGGSSGIGLEIARQLSRQGAQIWLVARRADLLSAALDTVQAERVDARQRFGIIQADVSDAAQAQAAVEQVTREIGLPDLVINSAGFAQPGYFHELDLDNFRFTMDVNYFGTLYITKAVVPGMMARGSGHIVNISSAAGFLGAFGYTSYSASKFAVAGFSDALRAEMKQYGIRVSIVFPADVDTPQLAYETKYQPAETRAMGPLRGVMSVEAVAAETLHGIAHGQYIILPGFDSKLMFFLTRFLGAAVHPFMDFLQSVMNKRALRRKV
jgi:3-dehydrosphinganine reductase